MAVETWTETLTPMLVLLLVGLLLYMTSRRRLGIPPGPPRWPVIGGMSAFVGKDTFTAFKDLRQKHGEIFSIYIGSEIAIVLNGYEAITNALVVKGRTFAWRPVNNFSRLMLRDVSLVFENGVNWKRHRQFVMTALHELCFKGNGISTLEDRINEELLYFTKELEKHSRAVDLNDLISMTFANVLYNVIHGRRAGYNNVNFSWYVGFQESEQERFCRSQLMHYCFPFLIMLPIDVLNTKRAVTFGLKLKSYFDKICGVNFRTYKEGDRKCLIDLWIAAVKDSSCLDKDNLWKIINELMSAGNETTATVFKWIVLCLAKVPEVQDKLRAHIQDSIGDRPVSLADKKHLPYARAVIIESLRFSNVVPLAVPHSVSEDFVFKGYLIPKNAIVIPNIASVNLDESIFSEPMNFKPERFLSEDGLTFVKPDKLIPFSIGPRSCLGETIAKSELFMYLITIVQKFKISQSEEHPLPGLVGQFGLTYRPLKYKVQLTKIY